MGTSVSLHVPAPVTLDGRRVLAARENIGGGTEGAGGRSPLGTASGVLKLVPQVGAAESMAGVADSGETERFRFRLSPFGSSDVVMGEDCLRDRWAAGIDPVDSIIAEMWSRWAWVMI